jgi:simple sugar transport system permease protein
MESIFNINIIYATIRSATPILYAAMCALITQQADILNIGTEGIMLIGSFAAVCVSLYTGSWVLAILVSILASISLALIMAVANIKFGADICAIGIAINLFALAITKFGILQFLGTSGTFTDPKIVAIPQVHIGLFDQNSFLNSVFNNWKITEILGIVIVIVLYFLLYRTVWGLRVRCVGRFPMAAETAGINVNQMKYQVMIISGILGGIGGAHLSLGYTQMFAENMTNGRGFMGVAAMFFGGMQPVVTWLGCLLFGLIDSIGARLQSYGWPSQFVLMLPYIITVTVLSISLWRSAVKNRRAKSSISHSGKSLFSFIKKSA